MVVGGGGGEVVVVGGGGGGKRQTIGDASLMRASTFQVCSKTQRPAFRIVKSSSWVNVDRTPRTNFEAQQAPHEALLELILGFELKLHCFQK